MQDRSPSNEDEDFAALSTRQQRAVDRAFDRGLKASRPRSRSNSYATRSRKRPRLDRGKGKEKATDFSSSASTPLNTGSDGRGWLEDEAASGGGGFMDVDDGGGFIADDYGGGGFMVDDDGGGGFMVDDDGGGGFIADDDGGGGGFIDDDGGGFVPEDDNEDEGSYKPGPSRSRTSAAGMASAPKPSSAATSDQIPFRLIPSLLSSLGLPSDKDILDVFRASATGWTDDTEDIVQSSRRGRGDDDKVETLVVSRKDFRAVCAVLLPPPEDGEEDMPLPSETEEGEGEGEDASLGSESSFDDDDSQAFRPSGPESDSDDDDGDGDYGAPPRRSTRGKAAKSSTTAAKGKAKGKGRARDQLLDAPKTVLTPRQRDFVMVLWKMFKPDAEDTRGVLSQDEVKRKALEMGEMWNESEISDMIKLFSTRHEGRGLSFEDFGAVMVRAGLV